MRHCNVVTSQFLCRTVQCGNATQLGCSMNGPLRCSMNGPLEWNRVHQILTHIHSNQWFPQAVSKETMGMWSSRNQDFTLPIIVLGVSLTFRSITFNWHKLSPNILLFIYLFIFTIISTYLEKHCFVYRSFSCCLAYFYLLLLSIADCV